MTGTTPHSHIGKTTPSNPLMSTAGSGLRGRRLVIQRAGTKTSIRPESSAPSSRNGTLSKSTLRNEKAKFCGTKLNQAMRARAPANREHNAPRRNGHRPAGERRVLGPDATAVFQ